MKKYLSVLLIAVFVFGLLNLNINSTKAAALPAGTLRCYFSDPADTSSAYSSLTYPQPASYTGSVLVDKTGKEGDTVPVTPFTLKWNAVRELGDFKYTTLTAAEGYTAVLSGDGISSQTVPLTGSYSSNVKVGATDTTYNLSIKKDGATVAACAVKAHLTVHWLIPYFTGGGGQSTGNALFPYTLQSVYGQNYIMKPLPDSPAAGVTPTFKFAGRYFDGKDRGGTNMGLGFEWFSVSGKATSYGDDPGNVRIAGDKLYVQLGNTIARYSTSNFISRLTNSVNNTLAVFAGTKEPSTTLSGSYDHAILPWDAYLYPEHRDNQKIWVRPACDCHTGITSFDIDDRGYIYFIDNFGFGIAHDEGATLRILGQHERPGGDNAAVHIVKTGGKYYAVSIASPSYTGKGGTQIYDVTNPNTTPIFVRSNPSERIYHLAIAGDTVAVNLKNKIQIYTAADFISGLSPKKEFSAGSGSASYVELAADNTSGKFYSINYSIAVNSTQSPKPSPAAISVFSPVAGSYTETKYDVSAAFKISSNFVYAVSGLDFNDGYLVSTGKSLAQTAGVQALSYVRDVRIWTLKSGAPTEINTGGFFQTYYHTSPSTFMSIDSDPDINIRTIGGKDYLFYNGATVADVYELGAGSGTATTGVDTGCAAGNTYSTQTGNPCVCVVGSTFALGTNSEAVRAFQQKLKDLGIYSGKVDGIYGPITHAADLSYCMSIQHPIYTGPFVPAGALPAISSINGPTSLGLNEQGTWTVTASDGNMDDLAWSVNWGEGSSILTCKVNPPAGTSQNWTYSASHAWTAAGTYTVTFKVNDCKGGATQKSFTVNVSSGGGSGHNTGPINAF
jgi:hypothetical protein